MKKIVVVLIIFFFYSVSFSQKISVNDLKLLRKKEDSLKSVALEIIQGRTAADRFKADSHFTKMFVRALRIPHSFNYPFDSLITISKLHSQDDSFKIFTWQMVINDHVVRQHGAIQMKTKDGSLSLFPLIDKSDVIENPADTIGNNLGWIGAVYYRLIEKQVFGKSYYTLLGYDENNLNSNKKIVEVLTFNDGKPLFGGSYFSFPDNATAGKSGSRFILEYKKNASPRLTFDEDRDMIIYEHLISETGEPKKKYTYIPDGDYEGLQWRNGKWVHINKVYTQKLEDGGAPVPNPIRDEKGNIDETKLSGNGTGQSTGTITPPVTEKPAKAKTSSKN